MPLKTHCSFVQTDTTDRILEPSKESRSTLTEKPFTKCSPGLEIKFLVPSWDSFSNSMSRRKLFQYRILSLNGSHLPKHLWNSFSCTSQETYPTPRRNLPSVASPKYASPFHYWTAFAESLHHIVHSIRFLSRAY